MGDVVERADGAADGDPPAAQVDVVEVQGAELSWPYGMDGGQRQEEAGLDDGGFDDLVVG